MGRFKYTYLLIFFICLMIPICSFAKDSTSELDFILSQNPISNQLTTQKKDIDNKPFKPSDIFIGMIRFYQLFISTQDMPVCNFTPSCSQFGVDSLRKFGIIKGILLTSDRLQRCNGCSAPYYQIDYQTGKYIDPVQRYIYLLNKN
ncbi:MAG: membrane protein insertion efficiency factor YidD [Candidatus Poribacteria bacterium]